MGLPVRAVRTGEFSDKYFDNIVRILSALKASGTTYEGIRPSRHIPVDVSHELIGDVVVEAQIFNRRAPYALVGGIDAALALLRYSSGVHGEPDSEKAWQNLEVEAIQDGMFTEYDGSPENVRPVIRIRGRYRDFALLETAILGYLTRITRIATSVYEVLKAAKNKNILFFPARFDLPEVQSADGYAYWLAVRRHREETGFPSIRPRISTDAQGKWWGGKGMGTIPHALIAAFLGDSASAMLAFAEVMPIDVPRILLADFNNDAVRATLDTLDAFWPHTRAALLANDREGSKRWSLDGVRLDTAGNLLDASLTDPADKGVSPVLVETLRAAIDAWPHSTGETGDLFVAASWYARKVLITVTGGFNAERIAQFERESVPVDNYGVGSSLLINDKSTATDFTMDVVRARLAGQWLDVAKVGRRPGDNPDLQPVNLAEL
ncbi:MAG: nicotinate phosphoribosyltransferase [Chloroflexi bacterium]|nr:nicotinate phosphoribosyltransferase [Chloroflexota bacterium]